MTPSSPIARRLEGRTPTLIILTALVAVMLFYTTVDPAEQRPSNRFLVRLNLETERGAASLEAAGTQEQLEQVATALAGHAAGSDGSSGSNPVNEASLQEDQGEGEEEELSSDADYDDESSSEEQDSASNEEESESDDDGEVPAQEDPAHAAAAEAAAAEAAAAEAAAEKASAKPTAKPAEGGASADGAAAPTKMTPEQRKKAAEQRSLQYKRAVDACRSFSCLRDAAKEPPGPGQFRFPHFYIIGFQKCATTSLFHHLIDHPQIQEPSNKEPEFFTKSCDYNAIRCHHTRQFSYMKDILRVREAGRTNFTKAAFEGSTHYALEGGWLASQMIELFPWIRVIVSMRDPISQAISMLQHSLEHQRVPSCFDGELIYPCIRADLDEESRYATSLRPWLSHFPREQLHFIQYENITGDFMATALRDVKRFLGIDPKLPSDDLGLFNYRHQRRHTDGWPMTRSNYLELVGKARRNAEEVVEIVRQYGFADADRWMKNWEEAWQTNLAEHCEKELEGKCMIHVT